MLVASPFGVPWHLMSATHHEASSSPIIPRLAWASLAFTVAVILGGAVVRATDSGAGCGESWPRCDGQIIPISPQGATLIEFTHRMMTAALAVALVALVIAVRRRHPAGHPVRRALRWTLAFFIGEVIIGAVLVLFGWVEDDESVGRIVAVSLHLVNTFLLLGAMALTAHLASGRPSIRFDWSRRRDRLLVAGVVTLLIVGATGALNALADTLYPAGSVIEGIRDEFGATAPFLLRIRTVHPLVAIAGGGVLFMLVRAPSLAGTGRVARYGLAVQVLLGAQVVIGLVNIALLTPVETQVVHLLAADALWIAWILLAAETLGSRSAAVAGAREAA